MVGLQINHIIGGLRAAIELLQAGQDTTRKKNTGVVRPGLNEGIVKQPEQAHKSAVVRPRVPVEVPNDNEAALQSVRARTASK